MYIFIGKGNDKRREQYTVDIIAEGDRKHL